jgi:hypothetical protein
MDTIFLHQETDICNANYCEIKNIDSSALYFFAF